MAIEAVRTRPTMKVVYRHAQMVGIWAGRVLVTTPEGQVELAAGDAFVLGAGVWCSLEPIGPVHTWTAHLDEDFLRSYGVWVLPPASRLRPGTHPTEWDGSIRLHHPGMATLREVEPFMRQLSVALRHEQFDLARSAVVRHFGHVVELVIPTLLAYKNAPPQRENQPLVTGRQASLVPRSEAVRAAELLRRSPSESWTVGRLAEEVSVSASHLPRLFRAAFGVPPMRYLNEVRLTAFVRLIEETDLTVSAAARRVGWADSRVASARFRQRFGMSPSAYRRTPQRWHAHTESRDSSTATT